MSDNTPNDTPNDMISSSNGLNINPGLPPTLRESGTNDFNKLEPTAPKSLIQLNEYWSYDPHTHTIALTSSLQRVDHNKIEAQAVAFAVERNAAGWTLLIEYFATGEGTHVWYQRSYASSKAEAVADFRQRFFADDTDRAWEFWSIGLEVHAGAYWPGFLADVYRIPPDELEMHWQSQM